MKEPWGVSSPAATQGISVVIPCYRSRDTIPDLVVRLLGVLESLTPHHEVILVVDGSPDDTAAVARATAERQPAGVVRVIELRRNYGQHNAILAGVAAAHFGVVVTMDDDLQHPPEELPVLLAPLADPAVDLVYGVAVEEEHGWFRSVASRTVKAALSMAGVPNAKDVSAFRAFRTDLRDAFDHVNDPFVSIDVVLSWATTSVRRASVRMEERASGTSGYTFRSLLAHTFNMATGYSILPLRLVTWLGLAVSLFGVAALVSVLALYWAGVVQVAGFTTVVAMLAILSGAIMLSLGILGEYLGRLHVRSMQRPAYLVRPPAPLRASPHGRARRRVDHAPAEGLVVTEILRPGTTTPPITQVRLTQPHRVGREEEYVARVLSSPMWHGDGEFTRRAETWLRELTGAPTALTTPSCTHALELAAILLDLGPGDEVICPSFTFTSTATAIAIRGATPVFVDVRPDTLNLDVDAVEAAITERTRAVFTVHYGGIASDVGRLAALTAARGLHLVEDNAHGLGAHWEGRHLGTFGGLATQSFHDTKNLTCGEGGALLINDDSLRERAEVVREKGTDRSRFLRGEVDKYTWQDVGSSYLLSEVSAALLVAQSEGFASMQARRHEIWDHYARAPGPVGVGHRCHAHGGSRRLQPPRARLLRAHAVPGRPGRVDGAHRCARGDDGVPLPTAGLLACGTPPGPDADALPGHPRRGRPHRAPPAAPGPVRR